MGACAGRQAEQGWRCRPCGTDDEAYQAPSGKTARSDTNKNADRNGGEKKANRRGAARLAAVQALYQMDIAGAGINDILAEFESHWLGNEVEGDTYLPAEAAFFRDVVAGVVRDQAKLDPLLD